MSTNNPRPLFVLLAACVLAGAAGLPAHADIIVTRQVSTGDISPTLYAQVHDGGPFERPGGGPHFLNVQLYAPAVDDGMLAFNTSSAQSGFYETLDTVRDSALYMIEDLVPQLHSDGSTNLNVKPVAHGITDPAVGRVSDLPDDNSPVSFHITANAVSVSGGAVSVVAKQYFVDGLGVWEGTTTTTTTDPVPSLGIVLDQSTPVLPDAGGVLRAMTFRQDGSAFARDGARTVTSAEMPNGRHALVSHEGGVRTVLLASFGPDSIPLPDGPYLISEYLDADAGEIALIANRNSTKVYHFDADDNASVLVNSGGPVLNYIALDGGEVVVGKRGNVSNAFNPIITPATSGNNIHANQPLLGDGLGAISRVDNGSLVDLVNKSTTLPGTGATFEGFGVFSYSDGNLAFLGSSTDRGGLYVLYEGTLHKVLEIGDTLEGKPVLDVYINRHGLDGDLLGFVVTHEITELSSTSFLYDQSIYTMSLSENFIIPEPASAALLALGGVVLMWRHRCGLA